MKMAGGVRSECFRRLLFFVVATLLVSAVASTQSVPGGKIRAAVVAFDNLSADRNAARLATDLVVDALERRASWLVASLGDVHKAVAAAAYTGNGPGEVDLQTIYDLRATLGIDVVVTGTVIDFEDGVEKHVSLTLRAIDARTGEVVWQRYGSKSSAYRVALITPPKSVDAYSLLDRLCRRLIRSFVGFRSRAVATSGEAEDLRLRLAELYYRRGRYTEAISHIEYVVSRLPIDDPQAESRRHMLGDTYERLGEWDQAYAVWERYEAFFPTARRSEITFRKGRALRMLGRHDEAVEALSLLDGLDDEWSDRALLEIAAVYRDSADYDRALDVLNEFVERRRDSELLDRAYLEIGMMHLSRGDPAAALGAAGTYIELFPAGERIATARYIYGRSMQELSNWPEAIRFLLKALPFVDDPVTANEIRYRLALCYQKTGDLERAAEYAESVKTELLTAEPARTFPAIVGRIYFGLGNHESALKSFTSYLQITPNDAEVLYATGEILLELGRTEEALSRFLSVVELGAGARFYDAIWQAATILHDEGRVDEAVTLYAVLGETENPYEFEALLSLAAVYFDSDRLDLAEQYLRKVSDEASEERYLIRARNWLNTIRYKRSKSEGTR